MTSSMLLLAAGFAGWLDVNGAGSWADVSGPYDTGTEWPIYLGPDMPSAPDQCIVITPTIRAKLRADITQGVQVRLRGRADAGMPDVGSKAQEISDLCYPNGFPRVHVTMGFLRVAMIGHGDESLLGEDTARRVEYVLNLRFRYRHPADLPPVQGYTLVAPVDRYVKSPDGSVRTIVTMTQAEYDASAPHDPSEVVIIIP